MQFEIEHQSITRGRERAREGGASKANGRGPKNGSEAVGAFNRRGIASPAAESIAASLGLTALRLIGSAGRRPPCRWCWGPLSAPRLRYAQAPFYRAFVQGKKSMPRFYFDKKTGPLSAKCYCITASNKRQRRTSAAATLNGLCRAIGTAYVVLGLVKHSCP